jgi:hypothetical protein
MKTIISSIIIALSLFVGVAHATAEVKKVCIDKVTKDGKPVLGKDGKQVQECKEMKIHKKLEGTKVPEKK